MKRNKGNNLNKRLILGIFFLLLILTSGVFIYWALSLSKIQSNIKDNSKNNSKIYSNNTDGFAFEYPNTYKINERVQEGNILIDLEKDQKLSKDGYVLIEGVNIRVTHKKNILLTHEYVNEENETYFESPLEAKIKKLNINGYDAFSLTYGYNDKLNVPGITRIYLKNMNNVLVLSFRWGNNITKSGYEEYQKQFDTIVNSVKFLK